jgi:acyl-ACP thioesterase
LEAPEKLGLTPDVLSKRYGAFWMLARVRYLLTLPIHWREEITLRTWHRPPKGMVLCRDFDILRSGTKIGEAMALWGLADLSTRHLINLGEVPELSAHTGGSLCRSAPLRPLPAPEEMTMAGNFSVPYSQTDRNGHFNNARYADLICDYVPMELWDGARFPTALQIDYRGESQTGDQLTLLRSAGEQKDVFRFRGLGADGTRRFDAMLTFAEE